MHLRKMEFLCIIKCLIKRCFQQSRTVTSADPDNRKSNLHINNAEYTTIQTIYSISKSNKIDATQKNKIFQPIFVESMSLLYWHCDTSSVSGATIVENTI